MSGYGNMEAIYGDAIRDMLRASSLMEMVRPTPEAVEAARQRRATERAAADLPQFTIDTLLARLNINRRLAEHLIQPYCTCWQDEDGTWLTCAHASDLGIDA